jgi:hypothetical protein
MNIAEALSRGVERVTDLRALYRNLAKNLPGDLANKLATGPAVVMMTAALQKAHLAAGSNDALEVMRAYEELKGFKE